MSVPRDSGARAVLPLVDRGLDPWEREEREEPGRRRAQGARDLRQGGAEERGATSPGHRPRWARDRPRAGLSLSLPPQDPSLASPGPDPPPPCWEAGSPLPRPGASQHKSRASFFFGRRYCQEEYALAVQSEPQPPFGQVRWEKERQGRTCKGGQKLDRTQAPSRRCPSTHSPKDS